MKNDGDEIMSAAYTITSASISSSRPKSAGAAVKRLEVTRNHYQSQARGWRETMERAAAENNVKWDPVHGWLGLSGYKSLVTPASDSEQDVHTISSSDRSSSSSRPESSSSDRSRWEESMKVASAKMGGRRWNSDLGWIDDGVSASKMYVPRFDDGTIDTQSASDTIDFSGTPPLMNLRTRYGDGATYYTGDRDLSEPVVVEQLARRSDLSSSDAVTTNTTSHDSSIFADLGESSSKMQYVPRNTGTSSYVTSKTLPTSLSSSPTRYDNGATYSPMVVEQLAPRADLSSSDAVTIDTTSTDGSSIFADLGESPSKKTSAPRNTGMSSYGTLFQKVAPRLVDVEGQDEKINIYSSSSSYDESYWL